jgi:hypothetical protein
MAEASPSTHPPQATDTLKLAVVILCSHPIGPSEQNRALDCLLRWSKNSDGPGAIDVVNAVRQALDNFNGTWESLSASGTEVLEALGKHEQLALPLNPPEAP